MKQLLILLIVLAATVGLIVGLVALQKDSPNNGGNEISLVRAVSASDHTIGSGPAVLVEYSDFQCPACGAYWPILKQLNQELADKVTIVYRHFPLRSIHPNADPAAQAAEAADRQGKFWEMADKLFTGQGTWSKLSNPKSEFEKYAQELGLDLVKFNSDYSSSAVKQRINDDLSDANAMNLSGTPTFFLNGKKITNPASYDAFKTLINQATP